MGTTQTTVEQIQTEIGGNSVVNLHDISHADTQDFDGYKCLIIGCPTWILELQSNWEGFYDELDTINFNNKKVAYFGASDRVGYADDFQAAMGTLEKKISSLGGKTVSYWSTNGYDFNESKAVRDGRFVGLEIDENNQSELTTSCVKSWVTQLKRKFGL